MRVFAQARSLPRIVRAAGLAACLTMPVSTGYAVAQTATPSSNASSAATASTGDTGLQRRPLDIENSQPDPHEEYLLGAGDDITVTVAGRPELSGTHIVGPDGRITLPMVGSVQVAEKSRDDAAKSIDAALAKDYSGALSSTVQVTKYGSNHILILGAIEHPGIVSFDQPPSLLEAVTRGGSLVNADHSFQMPKKCVIYRGDDRVMNINISDRFASNKALNDIRLRRNDIVYFPENQESLISVLGEVLKPGPERLVQTSTVLTLISNAGNITEKAGSNPEISVVQPSTGKVQKIRYDDLLNPSRATDIALHDGDIIFVPRSGVSKMGFFFQQVSPILGVGTIVGLVTH